MVLIYAIMVEHSHQCNDLEYILARYQLLLKDNRMWRRPCWKCTAHHVMHPFINCLSTTVRRLLGCLHGQWCTYNCSDDVYVDNGAHTNAVGMGYTEVFLRGMNAAHYMD